MSIAKKLAGIKNNWKNAFDNKKDSSGFPTFDDGRYLAIWNKGEVGESQGSGRLQVMLGFQVTEGEHKGETIRTYIGLEKEESIAIAIRTLSRLGVSIEDPTEMQDILDEETKKNKLVRLTLKTKGEFQNVYVDKVMGIAEGANEPEEAPQESEEAPETKEEAPAEESAEETASEPTIEVGSKVTYIPKGKKDPVEGEVTKMEETTAVVLVDGKKFRIELDRLALVVAEEEEPAAEEESAEESEVELKVGMKILVSIKGKDFPGVIKKLNEAKGTVSAKLDNGQVGEFSVDQIAVVEEKPAPKATKVSRK